MNRKQMWAVTYMQITHMYMVNMSLNVAVGKNEYLKFIWGKKNKTNKKHEFNKSRVEDGSTTAVAAMWKNWMKMGGMKRMTLREIKGNTPRSKSFLTKRGKGTKPLLAHAALDEDRNCWYLFHSFLKVHSPTVFTKKSVAHPCTQCNSR